MNHSFELDEEEKEQVEINSKYEGYIIKAVNQAEKLQKEHSIKIPKDIDYHHVNNLALEARDKLDRIRPLTISQASRISGVNPADIQMLLIHLRKYET
jgi:tRNA uridine 5-carboxymethylaminomethyl modification enzyme